MKCKNCGSEWHSAGNTPKCPFCMQDCSLPLKDVEVLYAIAEGKILTLHGTGQRAEESVDWMVQTGEIGLSSPDMKYISRMNVRMSMAIGATAEFYIQYDLSDAWDHICTMTGTSLRSFSVPIRPRRCDHMRLKIVGNGEAKIYSITKTIEQGSELS